MPLGSGFLQLIQEAGDLPSGLGTRQGNPLFCEVELTSTSLFKTRRDKLACFGAIHQSLTTLGLQCCPLAPSPLPSVSQPSTHGQRCQAHSASNRKGDSCRPHRIQTCMPHEGRQACVSHLLDLVRVTWLMGNKNKPGNTDNESCWWMLGGLAGAFRKHRTLERGSTFCDLVSPLLITVIYILPGVEID